LKLDGIRVVDLSMFLPGPYLSLAMADHGAEVIKIEAPGGGDPGRHIGLGDGEQTIFFRNLNRGKKSVVLDLKSKDGRDCLLNLCDSADVFLEAFRPGVMTRLGLDYQTISERNPKIVYCSISAFGQHGSYRDRPAHDLAVEAMAGISSMTEGLDGRPAIPGVPIADLLGGLQGLSGIMMALYRRTMTGRGDFIDIAMLDSAVAACANILGPTFAEGRQPNPKQERTTGGSAFYRFYETSDGRFIALAGQEAKFVRALLTSLGRPDLVELVLRGPGPHQREVVDFFELTFHQKSYHDWDAYLSRLDVCYGVVNTLPQALADPNLVSRKMLLQDESGKPHLGTPIHFLNEPSRPNLVSPGLGQHNSLFGAPPVPILPPPQQ
jgi:crotonobetainyl-CoA:carnitine CoA-transferase CaiB-like acyl-CoA transferase